MFNDPGVALAVLMSTLAAAKKHKPRPPTPEQIKRADERSERQRWNDEVDARKQAKKLAKEPSND